MDDLYSSRRDGIYWYTGGFNWRSAFAFVMGAWPFLPGLIMIVSNPNSLGANRN
jgi:nucleobase:cation symporter-1, NCS1 family